MGAQTFLSEHMLFNPFSLRAEAESLSKTMGIAADSLLQRVHVSSKAHVTTPYHRALNRIRELSRGDHRHGSCGMGIGETVQDYLNYPDAVITAVDIFDEDFHHRLKSVRDRLLDAIDFIDVKKTDVVRKELSTFALDVGDVAERMLDSFAGVSVVDAREARDLLDKHETVVFEGAQGVLLDQDYGFHPYTTWSSTTTKNALVICAEIPGVKTFTLGVTRTYGVRHGPGPFPTHSEKLDLALAEPTNPTNEWQREFRKGWPDLVLLKYGADLARIDGLAVTHVDALKKMTQWAVCESYAHPGLTEIPHPMGLMQQEELTRILFSAEPQYHHVGGSAVLSELGRALKKPIMLQSHGPSSAQKELFGSWPV